MTEQERKEIMNLADMIHGEVNRMCVTDDLEEADIMHKCAYMNIDELWEKVRNTKFVITRR